MLSILASFVFNTFILLLKFNWGLNFKNLYIDPDVLLLLTSNATEERTHNLYHLNGMFYDPEHGL